MSSEKELNFFIEERNWPKGVDWYVAQIPTHTRIRGESSPNYTAVVRFPGVPARMHSVVPDARLIYLVRDPIGSVRKVYGYFDLPFSDAVETRMRRFLAENPKDKHGQHRYTLEQFGLDRDEEHERYRAYCERFGL